MTRALLRVARAGIRHSGQRLARRENGGGGMTKAEREAERFNERYPVGTSVRYWSGTREGEGVLSETRSVAWAMCDHASVQVKGKSGSIALSHVEIANSTAPQPGDGQREAGGEREPKDWRASIGKVGCSEAEWAAMETESASPAPDAAKAEHDADLALGRNVRAIVAASPAMRLRVLKDADAVQVSLASGHEAIERTLDAAVAALASRLTAEGAR